MTVIIALCVGFFVGAGAVALVSIGGDDDDW